MMQNSRDGIMLERRDVNILCAGRNYALDNHVERNCRCRGEDDLLRRTVEQVPGVVAGSRQLSSERTELSHNRPVRHCRPLRR